MDDKPTNEGRSTPEPAEGADDTPPPRKDSPSQGEPKAD